MAFALVSFYKENTWDVIPYSNIILEDENIEKNAVVGLKTLVIWRDLKAKGKDKEIKVPAEILKISG